jgi:membrane-bound lytic murein transglycosylase F
LVGLAIAVPSGTSFVERLVKLRKTEPGLMWEERDDANSEKLMVEVANGDIEYTIADSHLVSILQNFYPNIGVAFAIGEPEKIAWALSKDSDPMLLEKTNAFFTKIKKDGTLRNLIDRYHGNAKRLNQLDIKTFLVNSNRLLPKYIHLFKQAQEITGIDWRLLAAISYQESHWDTFSTSPTNVRGLMMLTEATADRMGVTDRLDPKQSIPAGAKYINLLIDTIPERVPQPDRTYMALAAYNIGYAHVEDARVLAQRLKLNPDSWADVKKTLMMLTNPDYYLNAKYGYCSCGQPVIFVESIRSYQNILERYQPSHNPNQDDYKIARVHQILAAN